MGEILGDFLQRQFIGDERGNMDHKRERGGIYWRGLTKRGESAPTEKEYRADDRERASRLVATARSRYERHQVCFTAQLNTI